MFHHEDHRSVNCAHSLGWTSIGIGVAELFAPAAVENLLGIDHQRSHRGILSVLGVRELMHGIGILTAEKADHTLTSGLWARVAGDVLDNVLLAAAATKTKHLGRFAAVAAAVSIIGAADLYHALKVSRQRNSALNFLFSR